MSEPGQLLYLILQALKAIVVLRNLHYKSVLINGNYIMAGTPQPSEETRDEGFTLLFLLYLWAKLELKKHFLGKPVTSKNLKNQKWVRKPLLI